MKKSQNNKSPEVLAKEEMFKSFYDSIEQYKVFDKDAPYTHVSFDPEGKYYVKEKFADSFMTTYSNIASKEVVLTMAEKPSPIMPFRIDIDLKLPSKGKAERHYTRSIVEHIIHILHGIIEKYIDLTNDEDYDADIGENFAPYRCVLLEKPNARLEDTVMKDGFHLHFPYFYVNSWTSTKIHSELAKEMLKQDVWAGTPFDKQVNILDPEASNKNTWLLCGSAKNRKAVPYLPTAYYSEWLEEVTVREFFGDLMEGRKCRPVYYLPRFLSIHGVKKATPLKKEIIDARETEIRLIRRRAAQKSAAKNTNASVAENLATIQQGDIMDMISSERAFNYEQWYQMGMVLYSISQGSQEGLELWIDFSKRWEKFQEGECEILWGRMRTNNYTMGTLLWMARQDSPERYQVWRTQGLDSLIKKCFEYPKTAEYDVARVFAKLYTGRFVCANRKHKKWFEFRDHRWRDLDEGLETKKAIPQEFSDVFVEYQRRLTKKIKSSSDMERSWLELENKRCAQLIFDLKTETFQNKILTQASLLMTDKDFMKRKDENRFLWVCENGVLDLKEGIFRDGKPEDYCTYSCGYNYQEYTSDDPDVLEVEKYFSEVFPNPNLGNFFLDNLCSVMEGGNPQKGFMWSTGDGSNAKSITHTWLKMFCGDYCITFPQELFIIGATNASGAARPDLDRVRGRRAAVVNELSKKDRINIRILKELTGNDGFFGRGLYSDGGEINPMFKLFMQSNELPEMTGDDEASWERAFITYFEAKFVLPHKLKKYPVPNTREEQFKMKRFHADNTLVSRFPDLTPALLWLMFRRYKVYKQGPFTVPEEVLVATNRQRIKNDIYAQFKRDRLEKGGEGDYVSVATLFKTFGYWFKDAHPQSSEKISRDHFETEMIKRIGKPKQKGRTRAWLGWKSREDDEEDDDFEKKEGDAEAEGVGTKAPVKASAKTSAKAAAKKTAKKVDPKEVVDLPTSGGKKATPKKVSKT